MLLTIDIGNTNIKYAFFDGDNIRASFRVSSIVSKTADEYGATLLDLMSSSALKPKDVTGIIVSSVIPSLNYTIFHMCKYFFGISPLLVGPGIKTGLAIKVDNPREVGADIIVNSVGAYKKYGGPIVVIDFGTATTFDVISEEGELLGVVIAPGIKTSLNGLVKDTAQLPMVELKPPKKVVGKNTETAMQSGIIYGFAGLVDGIINKIKAEMGLKDIFVVATGGMGQIFNGEISSINVLDRTLTLEGLKTVYDLNCKEL